MVQNKDQVQVQESKDDMGVLLRVFVSKEDRGFIIGRDGETIKAIKRIFRVIGGLEKKRYNIIIEEEDGQDN